MKTLIDAIKNYRVSRYPAEGAASVRTKPAILPEKLSRKVLSDLCKQIAIDLPACLKDFVDGDDLVAHGDTLQVYPTTFWR